MNINITNSGCAVARDVIRTRLSAHKLNCVRALDGVRESLTTGKLYHGTGVFHFGVVRAGCSYCMKYNTATATRIRQFKQIF